MAGSDCESDLLSRVIEGLKEKTCQSCTDHGFWYHCLSFEARADGSVKSITINSSEAWTATRAHLATFKNLTVLRLHNFCLTDTEIPEQLLQLKALEELDFTYNRLEGALPPTLAKLQNLKKLKLHNNELSSVAVALNSLRQLVALDLSDNQLEGPIPPEIGNLTLLEDLDLSHNKISGSFPLDICRLARLRKLNLYNTNIFGPIPIEIGQLRALEMLNLNTNELTGPLPVELFNLTSLQELDVGKNEISGAIPPEIGKLASLRKLNLSFTKLSGNIPAQFAKLNALEEVNIYETLISGAEPAPYGAMRRLKVVALNYNNTCIKEETVAMFAKRNALEDLNDYETSIPDVVKHFRQGGLWLHKKHGPSVLFASSSSILSCLLFLKAQFDNATTDAAWCKTIVIFPFALLLYPKKLISSVKSPITVINQVFPKLLMLLRYMCEAQNPDVLTCLMRLWCDLTTAAKFHPAEDSELLEYAGRVEVIIKDLLNCNALNDQLIFVRLVLPKKYWLPKGTTTPAQWDAETAWSLLHVFEEGAPIRYSLDNEFKLLLASPAVASIMESLFYRCANMKAVEAIVGDRGSYPVTVGAFMFPHVPPDNSGIDEALTCPRYTPVMMFVLEGLGKATTLALIAYVTIVVYGKECRTPYANSSSEGFLLVMLFTHLAYELGQLGAAGWRVQRYLSDTWNTIDLTALVLIGVWAAICADGRHLDVARTLLSLSAIPVSLQMLQYISIVKSVGLLVLMIKGMVLDVLLFVFVYFVCIVGFGVCLYGLFYGNDTFYSSGATLMFLFQSTLGNFDFAAIGDSTYTGIGTAVLVVFLVLTTILLINLLIAQMSSTYGRIQEKSREEWSFVMASYVREYVLLRERSVLCMLPPPFNAITIAVAPLHYWGLEKFSISIAGQVVDTILGTAMLPLRLVYTYRTTYLWMTGAIVKDYFGTMLMTSWPDNGRIAWFNTLTFPFYFVRMTLWRMLRPVRVVHAPDREYTPESTRSTNLCVKYNVWYGTRLQEDEHRPIVPSSSENSRVSSPQISPNSADDPHTATHDVCPQEVVPKIDAAEDPAPSHDENTECVATDPAPLTSASPTAGNGAATPVPVQPSDKLWEQAAREEVVFFTSAEIDRIFVNEEQTFGAAASDDEQPADNQFLLAEVALLKTALSKVESALERSEAVQAEMLELIRTLTKK